MRPFVKAVAGCLLTVAFVAGGYVTWVVAGPEPTDFAGTTKVALARYRDGDPTGVPRTLVNASLVERGRYLATAADCVACHTSDGPDFAGGRLFLLPFGKLYSTNITPDAATGIGRYTDEQFIDAVRRGIRADGARLYPAMPFVAYQGMTNDDVLAIKAFLFSVPAQRSPARSDTLIFPFDQRPLLATWSWLFSRDRRFEPHADQSLEWNRGAYLVTTLAHCAECHTPRTPMQSVDHRREFGGAIQAGWNAYNITSDRTAGLGDWRNEDFARYLEAGHADGVGGAAGPMREAYDLSLRHLDPADIAAIVAYVRTVPAVAGSPVQPLRRASASVSHRDGASEDHLQKGKAIFAAACVSCHGWTGKSPLAGTATLTGVRSINDAAGTNVAQAILNGVATGDAMPMPSFAALSDDEVALASNYVTARFGGKGSSLTAEAIAKLRGQSASR